MNFLKKLWTMAKHLVRTAVVFAIRPAMPLVDRLAKKADPETFGIRAFLGLVARVTFVASFFVAVPAFLLSFAKFWLISALVLTVLALLIELVAIAFGVDPDAAAESFQAWVAKKEAEEATKAAGVHVDVTVTPAGA